MALSFSVAAKNAALAAVTKRIDGSGQGQFTIRSGTIPAAADNSATGVLLCTINLLSTSFGTPVSGVVTCNGLPLVGAIVATGTAGWFRVLRGDGSTVMDGTITGLGGGGDLELDNTSMVSGGTMSIQSWNISQ